MGWMWSSPSPPPPSKGPNSSSNNNNNNNSNNNGNNTKEEGNKPTQPPKPKQADSDYGDPELAKFIAQIQEEFGGGGNSSNSSSKPSQPSSTTTTTTTSFSSSNPPPTTTTTPQSQPPSHLDPISESLLPTSMSCREAFDAAYHCNSLGGQWLSLYRAGGMRSCSEKWDDFWFCMRARAYSGPQKTEAIRAHYRAREWAKYHAPGKPSSTDIWEAREELVEPGSAFTEPLYTPDVPDEEWRVMEIERRRRIQEMLREHQEKV
ncbi:uncharacterized protein GGS25DRAFT_198205 [Hypoxylon fragiforme]|uniref:uncharacterized protein n=1 Tax=Hypoxylon fragiforme TaxID=63214 RepID=UPI0020C63112|nr:uncharacterized protein GGS25DRAFT_198205 [Hypoxylon fragiforme]KAI2611483.1 hypothetical protein GGS25DRAFT_198205 [Hypoxylon fragiforme]